jgi:Xaa-Pro dipeptidase
MFDIERTRNAIREEGLSGWLFYNVFHRDQIADLVLEVPVDRINTRPWICVVSLDRPPVKIVHRIEQSILQHLPGVTVPYSSREEFSRAVAQALPATGSVAADYSSTIPVGSYFDHGAALFLQSLGAKLAPSEGLIARLLGTIDSAGFASHEAAGKVLYAVVKESWTRLAEAVRAGRHLTEGIVQDWIMTRLAEAGLESDAPPVVGFGVHTNDPHYGPDHGGAELHPGDTVQLDTWARHKTPGAVYADISWVGVCASEPTTRQLEVWDAVVQAREAAVDLLQKRLAAGAHPSGAEVDTAARQELLSRGFAAGIKHRTGHSIGARVHGYGVNLDSVEFPDHRPLTEGSCFSVEPGLYLEDFGMRTEIDCCITAGRLVVTGGSRQSRLLTVE